MVVTKINRMVVDQVGVVPTVKFMEGEVEGEEGLKWQPIPAIEKLIKKKS